MSKWMLLSSQGLVGNYNMVLHQNTEKEDPDFAEKVESQEGFRCGQ